MNKETSRFIKSISKSKVLISLNIFWILSLAFFLRIIISPFGTLTLDQNTFIAWSQRLINVGIGKFYFGTWSDYLPGYLYVLSILGQIAKTNIIPTVILYKLPAIISDLATGFLIYKIIYSKQKNKNIALIGAIIYVFNPAIFANSSLWGQVDSLTAFFSLLSIYTIESNPFISAISLAIGTLIKPQMAIISLIILILMIQKKENIKKFIIYIFTGGLTFLIGFLPFANGTNLLNFVISRLIASLNQYPYTSVNAFNFWAIIGTWKPDTGLNILGGVIALILFFIFGLKFLKNKGGHDRPGGEYILLSFTYAISFLFMTRMHERHLLPVFAPLTIAAVLDPIFIFALIGFSFVYLANLFWAWAWVSNNFQDVFGNFTVKLLSLINVSLLLFFLLPQKITDSLFGNLSNRLITNGARKGVKIQKTDLFKAPKINSQKIKIFFIAVVIFASITRFYNLGSPKNHYFDEVYHAFTAQNMLHGITYAWQWWNANPDGFAYEWTHPPLAKEGMALGMNVLGENSFGWRFSGALLGVGSIILIFFIAKEIFNDELIGLLASAVLALDGLALVLSRIGMNDSYVLFFVLASVLSFLKKKNLFSAIFLGLALASKWSAISVIPIIFVMHFVLKRKFNWTYIFFLFLPPVIYISSYFPIFTNREIQTEYVANTYYRNRTDYISLANPLGKTGIIPLDMFLDVQKQMWWYHTRLKATHPYSSLWYTWPFLIRPIYLYTSPEINGTVARIYAMGNPVVFWFGITGIVISSFIALNEKNKKLGLVVFCYLIFFAMWAASPRIMFLYHYLPSIPFLAIATAYLLRRYPKLIPVYFIIGLLLFIYFYPHWTGLKIPLQLDSSYYWFDSWR